MDGWAKIKQAATYAGMSERSLRGLLKQGLRHSRLPSGTILVKIEWVDGFLESHEVKEHAVDQIVRDIGKELTE